MIPLRHITLKDAVAKCAKAWHLDLAQSYDKLRPYLHANEVRSCVEGAGYKLVSEPEYWAAHYNDHAWFTGQVGRPNAGPNAYMRDSFIEEESLNVLLGLAVDKKIGQEDEDSGKNKGGRRPKYDWNKIWAEMCRIAVFEGLPSHSAELKSRMQLWYAKEHNSAPSDTMMKEAVAALYKAQGRAHEVDK